MSRSSDLCLERFIHYTAVAHGMRNCNQRRGAPGQPVTASQESPRSLDYIQYISCHHSKKPCSAPRITPTRHIASRGNASPPRSAVLKLDTAIAQHAAAAATAALAAAHSSPATAATPPRPPCLRPLAHLHYDHHRGRSSIPHAGTLASLWQAQALAA